MTAAHDAALEYIERLEAALAAATGRLTEAVATLAGLSLNHVLRNETLVLGSTGKAKRETRVPYAAVGAFAYGSDITVVAGPNQATAPTSGIGVIIVPASRAVVWPLTGTELMVFGTPGDRVLLTLFSAPQVPSVGGTASGTGTVDGGGA